MTVTVRCAQRPARDRGRDRAAQRGLRRRAGRRRSRRTWTAATRGAPPRRGRRRRDASSAPAACSSTAPTLKLGRMAVAAPARRQGIGLRAARPRRRARPTSAGARAHRARRAGQRACRSTSRPGTARAATSSSTPASSTSGWRSSVPEVRVDPLTGHKTIIADERAARPGRGSRRRPPDPPIDPETDPFLEGHEDRTPPGARRAAPGRLAPDTPGWQVRVVPNLYPALSRRTPARPTREARRRPLHRAAAHGHHEVIVNAPRPVSSLADLEPGELAAAMGMWRAADRATTRSTAPPTCTCSSTSGARRGASLPHTHAQLVALDFVPALRRPRARALRRLRHAHDGRQPARRPRAGGGAAARAHRRDRRRGRRCSRPTPRGSPYQLLLAPRRPRARFEDDGPLGAALLHDALRRLARRFGHAAAAEPLGAHRAARRRALLLADRHPCRAWPRSPGSSSGPGSTSTSSRPSTPRASCASV